MRYNIIDQKTYNFWYHYIINGIIKHSTNGIISQSDSTPCVN